MNEEKIDNVKITNIPEIISKNKNENLCVNKCRQKKFFLNFYIYIYLCIYLLIIIFFLLNFMYTKNILNEDKNIYFLPKDLCNKILNIFLECIKNKNDNNIKCYSENNAVEDCYDETNDLNHLCKFYIKGLELCLKKNKDKTNLKNKCKNELNDIVICGRYYEYLELDQDKIINYLINF